MMYFSCRKPHHSGELRCVKTTCSSPFTRGEREKRHKTLSSNRACLHQNFFRPCLRLCYKTGQRWCDTATALARSIFLLTEPGESGVPSGAQQCASTTPLLSGTARCLLCSPALQSYRARRNPSAEVWVTLQLCLSSPLCSLVHHRYKSTADLELSLPVLFRLLGLRMSLSSMLTICPNLGLSLRSFCQQSNISWWRAMGQSIGGGSRYPSSMALITYKWHN